MLKVCKFIALVYYDALGAGLFPLSISVDALYKFVLGINTGECKSGVGGVGSVCFCGDGLFRHTKLTFKS